MFYGHILSTACKKGIVLSKERTLLAFSEEMPSSFQVISPNVWGMLLAVRVLVSRL